MNDNHYIAIMAGGIGSRFWPSSKADRPKQFLDILGTGQSLIRQTYERVLPLCPPERILVVTNGRYKSLVQEHLPEIPEENILMEPSRNNTAPSVAYTALHLQARNPKAVFAMLPSDHVILKDEAYRSLLGKAFEAAESDNKIVTLGISPTRPDTGYGYIELGNEVEDQLYKVAQFKEKPEQSTAQEYLDSGNYLWNAGMFIWSVPTILNAFEECSPEIKEVLERNINAYGTPEEQAYINEVYPHTPSISVDYAILEKYSEVYSIPADIGWSDLGTWSSLHVYKDKDINACVILGENTHLIDTKNTIVRSDSEKIVVIKGLKDYIIVDEPDALLIYPKSDEQEVKEVVKGLKVES